MKWLHNFALCLLPCGFVFYCYGLYTGAGLSGWLMRWQIESRGSLLEGFWEALSFFVLVIVPLIVVTNTEKRTVQLRRDSLRPMVIFFSVTVGLTLLAGLGGWKSWSSPDLNAKPRLVSVESAGGIQEAGMTQLVGQSQNKYMLSYVGIWALGKGATSRQGSKMRSLLPVTPIAWKPEEPVRFLISSRGTPAPTGILQKNSLPAYLRTLIEKKGIRLADPYYVVDNDAYLAAKGEWDALAAIAGFFAFIFWILFFAVFWPFVDLRNRVRLLLGR
jgi:hypothetical protein